MLALLKRNETLDSVKLEVNNYKMAENLTFSQCIEGFTPVILSQISEF